MTPSYPTRLSLRSGSLHLVLLDGFPDLFGILAVLAMQVMRHAAPRLVLCDPCGIEG